MNQGAPVNALVISPTEVSLLARELQIVQLREYVYTCGLMGIRHVDTVYGESLIKSVIQYDAMVLKMRHVTRVGMLDPMTDCPMLLVWSKISCEATLLVNNDSLCVWIKLNTRD